MKIGIAMFPTDYSITPGDLGQAVEERGFESLWLMDHVRQIRQVLFRGQRSREATRGGDEALGGLAAFDPAEIFQGDQCGNRLSSTE